jgi:hypothetical protein
MSEEATETTETTETTEVALPAAEEVAETTETALPAADEVTPSYDWEADTGKLGEIELPEGLTIGGREAKGTVKDALTMADERVRGMRKLMNEKGQAAPEEYKVGEDTQWAQEGMNEVLKDLFPVFKEMELTQSQVDGTLGILSEVSTAMAELAKEANKVNLMDHWNLTGDDFKARLNEVAAWSKENMDEETYEKLRGMGPQGIIIAENHMLGSRERPMYKQPGSSETETGLLSTAELAEIQDNPAYGDPNHKDHAALKARTQKHFALVAEQRKMKPPRGGGQ